MKIKGVILAGGRGTRLFPITENIPKPMVPVCGKPAVMHIIELLADNGITDISVTTGHLAEKIEALECDRVKLRFFREESPLGTAGGVKRVVESIESEEKNKEKNKEKSGTDNSKTDSRAESTDNSRDSNTADGIGDSTDSNTADGKGDSTDSNTAGKGNSRDSNTAYGKDNSTDSNTADGKGDSTGGNSEDVYLIIGGDCICNFDIRTAVEEHLRQNSRVTLLLTESAYPPEYGSVLAQDGVVVRFTEKPSWRQTVTNLVNTGIYIIDGDILRMIPDGAYDFSKDLFPRLMSEGIPLRCRRCDGYWYDIGSIQAYYDCNFDLGGDDLINIVGDATVSPDHGDIEGCIIFDGVKIGKGVSIKNSIICSDTVIGDNCIIRNGCVLGHNTELGKGCTVGRGVIISGEKKIKDGSKLVRNTAFAEQSDSGYGDGVIKGSAEELDSEYFMRLGIALANMKYPYKTTSPAKIGVMRRAEESSAVLERALLCGIEAGGAVGVALTPGFESLCAFAVKSLELSCSVFIGYDGQRVNVTVFDCNALNPSHGFARALQASGREKHRRAVKNYPTSYDNNALTSKYTEFIKAQYNTSEQLTVKIPGTDKASAFLAAVALQLGINVVAEGDYDTLMCDESGLIPTAITREGVKADYWHIFAAVIDKKLKGVTVAVPSHCPIAVEEVLKSFGADISVYTDSENDTRSKALGQLYLRDGLSMLIKLAEILAETKKSLLEILNALPSFAVVERDIECEECEKARTIARLAENANNISRPESIIRLWYSNGSVAVIPMNVGGFRLYAEALNTEIAEELCDIAQNKDIPPKDSSNK